MSVGTGFQVLNIAPPGAPNGGPYVIICQLPAADPGPPSYISSYRVLEP